MLQNNHIVTIALDKCCGTRMIERGLPNPGFGNPGYAPGRQNTNATSRQEDVSRQLMINLNLTARKKFYNMRMLVQPQNTVEAMTEEAEVCTYNSVGYS